MKRPADQAKIVVFGLLRTAAALAAPRVVPNTAAAAASSLWPTTTFLDRPYNKNKLLPPLTLRVANRGDIDGIQRCNLATLPENYNTGFFQQHLRTWPDLSLVVCASHSNNKYNGGAPQEEASQQVVAYLLGKIEERHQEQSSWYGGLGRSERSVGHVTSLAVLPDYRRQGLAQALLEQLHHQLQTTTTTTTTTTPTAVGLHVRPSNSGATRLYQRLGYRVVSELPTYYHDGENGYYMVKDLREQQKHQQQQHHQWQPSSSSVAVRLGGGNGGTGRWRHRQARVQPQQMMMMSGDGKNFALPRLVGRQADEHCQQQNQQQRQHGQQQQQQHGQQQRSGLLSGSL